MRVIILCLTIVLIAGCVNPDSEQSAKEYNVLDRVDELLTNHESHSSPAYWSDPLRVVTLIFLTTPLDCPSTRFESDQMRQLYIDYLKLRHVRIVEIDASLGLGEAPRLRTTELIPVVEMPYDMANEIFIEYNIAAAPAKLVLSRSGRLLYSDGANSTVRQRLLSFRIIGNVLALHPKVPRQHGDVFDEET